METKPNLRRYKCYKEVQALKIVEIENYSCNSTKGDIVTYQSRKLHFDNGESIAVSFEYMDKHNPVEGGYYVVYSDGYESFSPSKSFEEGYQEII